MAAKLSPAVVSTGPTDELLANDGRGNTPQDTINKQNAEPSQESNEITDEERLCKIKIPTSKIAAFVANKISSPKISDSAAQQSLEASIGSRLVNIYGDVTGDADALRAQQRAITAFRDDVTGRDKNGLLDVAGNITEVWDRTDPSKVTQLTTAFRRISSNLNQVGIIDEKGKFAASLGILDQAVRWGIPQLIDDIVTYVKNNKESKRILIEGTRQVIQRSDLLTLNKILDIIGSEGVLQRVPDAISLLLMFYRFKWGTKPENYPERRIELLSTLNRIKPNWHLTTRNGGSVTDLGVTNYMSANARTLLSLVQAGTNDSNYFDQPHILEALLVSAYPSRNIQQLGRSMYPEIAAWGG